MASNGPFWMHERIDELRAWAKSRIAFCEGIDEPSKSKDPTIYSFQRAQELQTLRAVLAILDGESKDQP